MPAQSLKKHQWNDRLILILTNNQENVFYKKQVELFSAEKSGMEERKLIVYHLLPEKYCTGMPETTAWRHAEDLFKKFKKTKNGFEIILIGLDGGIKLRQNELLSTRKLFELIDGMPMRQAEIRNKGN